MKEDFKKFHVFITPQLILTLANLGKLPVTVRPTASKALAQQAPVDSKLMFVITVITILVMMMIIIGRIL